MSKYEFNELEHTPSEVCIHLAHKVSGLGRSQLTNDAFYEVDVSEQSLASRAVLIGQLINRSLNEDFGGRWRHFGARQVSEIKGRLKLLLSQCEFWVEQQNTTRFSNDLDEFLQWLYELAGVKNKWGFLQEKP